MTIALRQALFPEKLTAICHDLELVQGTPDRTPATKCPSFAVSGASPPLLDQDLGPGCFCRWKVASMFWLADERLVE